MQTFEEAKKDFDAMVNRQQETACTETATYDPVAEMQRECDAMQAELMDKERELASATKKNEELAEELAEKQTALQNANAMTKQWQDNARNLGQHLKKEKDGRDEDRKRFDEELERIRKYVNKPIRLPLILAIACGVLSLLVGVCIDQDLMTCVLGDPLGAGLLAACALFAGVVYERLRLR